nr:MAG TPA: hypothetical protein [Caudoviricetes sp.]DAJ56632.1 MAG TPA: hypothetical protein [Caudoviricetes sp.]DAR73453.1 MAG TPA: hypothetical protein [Caudoviricetes sp.]
MKRFERHLKRFKFKDKVHFNPASKIPLLFFQPL